MSEHIPHRNNILGQISAELDHQMLDEAFYESDDYNRLSASSDKNIIVGRRGTGKSSLVYKLMKVWDKKERTNLILPVAEEDQIPALRRLFSQYGTEFTRIKAAARIAWRYALLMEIVTSLQFIKDHKIEEISTLRTHLHKWRSSTGGMSTRLRDALKRLHNPNDGPEDKLADLSRNLEVNQLQSAVGDALNAINRNVILMLDRLDEGYEPDITDVAIVDGFVQAGTDLDNSLSRVSVLRP